MLPEISAPAAPSIAHVTDVTNARAARVAERCSYRAIGYVMEHPQLAKRSIVVGTAVRWFPNDDEFQRMMGWKKYSDGPGIPAEGWPVDDMPEVAPVAIVPTAAAAPSRPVLTAAPSAKLLESTEAALGELARELGCVFNEDIPHNAGWFVPGKPRAYASAYDAIRGLFASFEAGGTVYRPSTAPAAEVVAAPKKAERQLEAPQGALF